MFKDGEINYIYNKNVKTSSVDAVKNTMNSIKNQASKNKDIFNIDIEILSSHDKPKTELAKQFIKEGGAGNFAHAFTIDPLYLNTNQELVVMTDCSFTELLMNKFKSSSKVTSDISNNVIHEFGHIFDRYFGKNPNNNLQKQLKGIMAKEIRTEDEYNNLVKIYDLYEKTSDLSDKNNFKEAYQKDVNTLVKQAKYNKILNRFFDYSPGLYANSIDEPNKIDISDGIDEQEVDASDRERNELFAQLFAFALGYDNRNTDKELMIKTYSNSYNVVKGYIKEYLGIDCDKNLLPNSSLNCEI